MVKCRYIFIVGAYGIENLLEESALKLRHTACSTKTEQWTSHVSYSQEGEQVMQVDRWIWLHSRIAKTINSKDHKNSIKGGIATTLLPVQVFPPS